MNLDREDYELLQAVAAGEVTHNGFWFRGGVQTSVADNRRLARMSPDLIETVVQRTAFLPVHLTPAGLAALKAGLS